MEVPLRDGDATVAAFSLLRMAPAEAFSADDPAARKRYSLCWKPRWCRCCVEATMPTLRTTGVAPL